MKASVALITYNHAPYIARAIESVLAQRTSFDFELLIGEDDSTDGTRAIVQEFAARHPERIRLFLRSRQDVIHVDGRPTGRFNFMQTIGAARGEYVALLEGDDYWTSPEKLQRQVDFLEANRDCAACFHAIDIERCDAQGSCTRLPRRDFPPDGARLGIEEMLRGGVKIPLLAYVFRRAVLGEFPPWFTTLAMGDIPLYALNAAHGPIGFIHEFLGTYTLHAGGVWSAGENLGENSHERMRLKNDQSIRLFETLDAHFDGRFRDVVAENVATLSYQNAWSFLQSRDFAAARECTLRARRAKLLPRGVSPKLVLTAWLGAFLPAAYLALNPKR